MINFTLVGNLKAIKETDKFKPYQEREFDSGWVNRTLMFNAVCGDNRHMLTLQGGCYPQSKDYKVKTFSPSYSDDSGNRKQGEKIEIPWKDRLLQSSIEKVAVFKKTIVDLEVSGRRRDLENFATKLHEGGTLTDEELQRVGLKDESEVAEALEASKKKRREFITAWDAAEYVKRVLDSGEYENKKFYIRGQFECRWSDQNQQWYTNMIPQSIMLAKPDSADMSQGSTTLFFTSGAVDDMDLDEKNKYYVNAYTFEYDSTRKKNIPCPFQLVIPDKMSDKDGRSDSNDEARSKLVVKKFTVEDDSVKEYGVQFDILNGSQRMEITPDMLTDEQREELDLGMITMDDIRSELGSSVYGERIRENRYSGIMRGYSKGVKDTAYTSADLEIPPLEDVTEGLFDDEDSDEL